MCKRKFLFSLLAFFVISFCISFLGENVKVKAAPDESNIIEIAYDDYLDFNFITPGYKIKEISDETVTSYQVVMGAVTGEKDAHVIKAQGEAVVRATGCGEATIRMENKANPLDIMEFTIIVKPAKLSVVIMAGQSSMEGCATDGVMKTAPNQYVYSVPCENGTCYSSYLPRGGKSSASGSITGESFSTYYKINPVDVNRFVPGSLTSDISLAGTKLEYKPYALTELGKGKSGIDSAMAYEWNRLTGEKMWLINVAYGGSTIIQWLPQDVQDVYETSSSLDCKCYERAVSTVTACYKTLDAEVASGHFECNEKYLLWYQGFLGTVASEKEYQDCFEVIWNRMRTELNLDNCYIISSKNRYGILNESCVEFNISRLAQMNMTNNSKKKNIIMLSAENEEWINDKSIKEYFAEKYPDNEFTYPTRQPINIPSTHYDIRPMIHYTQVALNEIGLTVARNLYNYRQKNGTAVGVKWKSKEGRVVSAVQGVVGARVRLISNVVPTYYAKSVTYKCEPAGIASYDATTNTLDFIGKGKCVIFAYNSAGEIIETIPVESKENKTKVNLKVRHSKTGFLLKWNKFDEAFDYTLYRKIGNGKYKQIFETKSKLYYVDDIEKLSSQVAYRYKLVITAKYNDSSKTLKVAGFVESAKYRFITPPILKKTRYVENGVKIYWEALEGVPRYAVFRKEQNGKYVKIGSTTNSYYVDSSLIIKSNKTYYYTVKAIDENREPMSTYDERGVSIKYYKTPKLTQIKYASTGVKISWEAETDVKYAIYRKTKSDSAYSRIGTKYGGSFIDKKAAASTDKKYYYIVRRLNRNDIPISMGAKKPLHIFYAATPKFTTSKWREKDIKLVWEKSPRVYRYAIYRSVNDRKLELIGYTKKNYYFDKQIRRGRKYNYAIRAMSADGKYISGRSKVVRLQFKKK